MTRSRARGAAPNARAPSARKCVRCGRELTPFTPNYVAARLRKLLAEVGKQRPARDGESEAQRNEARAEWYSTAHAVMRVTLSMLADEADGICCFCSDGGGLPPAF